jgi:hypothetical protein
MPQLQIPMTYTKSTTSYNELQVNCPIQDKDIQIATVARCDARSSLHRGYVHLEAHGARPVYSPDNGHPYHQWGSLLTIRRKVTDAGT